jgi:peptidyl-tRNA hydrolase, PTH1 family
VPFFSRRHDAAADDLQLVIGLGNPGSRFAGTRHNVGAMTVESLAQRNGLRLQGSKHAAATARGSFENVPVLLAVPDTYMNESGVAVARLTRYYKIPPDRLLIICDDLDIPFGTLRIRPDGGSGGHNGLKSIISAIGTQQFPRLRVGVGRPVYGAIDHVLGRFSPEEERLLPRLLQAAGDAANASVVSGPRDAMNRFNRDWLPTLLDSPAEAGS